MTITIIPASESLLTQALKHNRVFIQSKEIRGDELHIRVGTALTADELRKKIVGYAGFFWMEIQE